jgi:hypothetical protein
MEVIDGAVLVRFSMNEVCLDAEHYIWIVSQRDPVKAVTGLKMSGFPSTVIKSLKKTITKNFVNVKRK